MLCCDQNKDEEEIAETDLDVLSDDQDEEDAVMVDASQDQKDKMEAFLGYKDDRDLFPGLRRRLKTTAALPPSGSSGWPGTSQKAQLKAQLNAASQRLQTPA